MKNTFLHRPTSRRTSRPPAYFLPFRGSGCHAPEHWDKSLPSALRHLKGDLAQTGQNCLGLVAIGVSTRWAERS